MESRSEHFPPHFVHIFGHNGKVIGIEDVKGLTDNSINNKRKSVQLVRIAEERDVQKEQAS